MGSIVGVGARPILLTLAVAAGAWGQSFRPTQASYGLGELVIVESATPPSPDEEVQFLPSLPPDLVYHQCPGTLTFSSGLTPGKIVIDCYRINWAEKKFRVEKLVVQVEGERPPGPEPPGPEPPPPPPPDPDPPTPYNIGPAVASRVPTQHKAAVAAAFERQAELLVANSVTVNGAFANLNQVFSATDKAGLTAAWGVFRSRMLELQREGKVGSQLTVADALREIVTWLRK